MAEARSVLEIDRVSKVYRAGELAVTALEDVSLEVKGGEIVAVMGPSGSGKTTLLTIGGALLRPTKGRVRICDIEVTGMNESRLAAVRREKVGFIYQSFNLLEALTALENVRVVIQNGRRHGRASAAERAAELLQMIGLEHRLHALPKKMSDGEKQRVAIARALAKDADLLLADEPTANLDARRGQEVMGLLSQKALEMGKAVVVVSHDERIKQFAHRVLWLEDGRLRDGHP
jgi:putative ABC transport system ATP-binding protein